MPSRLTVVLVSLLLATPAVAFWLWLVIVPARVAILCSEGCECDLTGYTIRCHFPSINFIPLIHPTDAQELLLFNNHITLLKKDSFVSMTELKFLDISMCEMRIVELGAFNGLTELIVLSMLGNEIREILPGTFENMSSLEILDISNNKIKHLNRDLFSGLGAFNGLTNLKRLSIYHNEIYEIIPGTFENMRSLEYLDLGINEIKKLNSAMFSGLGGFNGLTKLRQLEMYSDEINEILTGTFENMSSLVYLNLGNNIIEHLVCGVFSGLFNLKYLDLSANDLQYLHPHTFLGLPNIQHLKFNGNGDLQKPTDRYFITSHSWSQLDKSICNISSLSVETFANVRALKSLDVRGNFLRTIDINILRALPELSELYLHNNPLQCDCQLQEVWRWCEDRNIRTVYEAKFWIRVPECGTPSEVSRMWWGVLEKGQCLDGNINYVGDYKNTRNKYTGAGEQKYDYEYGDHYGEGFIMQYQVPIYAVAFIYGTTANLILLLILICNKDMRTDPNMYILNLAMTDTIYLTVFLSEACVNRITDTWRYNELMCVLFPFCRRMSIGLSAYSVALYSFQRYRVTVSPFQVPVSSQPKRRHIVATICGV
jgi:Leucine-rich repeat (LRR) protein